MATCAFCGRNEGLTREHVLGVWLAGIGLDLGPVNHRAGWLNRLGRDLGVSQPFTQTVREVCADCNNGWMSSLEDVARRVLRRLILGEAGVIELGDTGAIAAWAQKTALVAMLVSSEGDRAAGYGLPSSEYRGMHARSNALLPFPESQFWIGRYSGVPSALQQVTPLVVRTDGQPEPSMPHAYLMTVILGQLVLQGVRFTTPTLELNLSTRQGMPRLWPSDDRIHWPAGTPVDEGGLLRFCGGKDLLANETAVATVAPWRPATNLEESRLIGSTIELDVICGQHVIYYPAVLAQMAMSRTFHAFTTSCECGVAYLVETGLDGAHFKAAGTSEAVVYEYDLLRGQEMAIQDAGGIFLCKRLVGSFEVRGD